VYGNFSAPKVQEIIVSRGKVLELLRPDEQGKVQVIHSTEVFGIIRSLAPFRRAPHCAWRAAREAAGSGSEGAGARQGRGTAQAGAGPGGAGQGGRAGA
jgi:hypothetical protein